ncbi:MAG TPA: DUF1580 domain-containing protein [Gemmataceae bacterium]|jgi:hypothetical protein
MIDIHSETLIGFSDAARRFPACRQGRPVNPSTLWRWCRVGVRQPGGARLKLEFVRVGSRCLTSVQALDRFIAQQTANYTAETPASAVRTPNQRHRAADRAGAELAAAGL